MAKSYKYGVLTLDVNSDYYGLLVYNDKKLAEKCYKSLYEGSNDIKQKYGNGLNRSDAVAAYEFVIHNVFNASEQFIDWIDINNISEKVLWGKTRKVFGLSDMNFIIVNPNAVKVNL